MKNTILFISIILIFSGCISKKSTVEKKEPVINKENIVWSGFARQLNNNNIWPLSITKNRGKYSIDYPTLKCGGTLTLLSESPTKIEFREKITYGKLKCIDNGLAVIQPTSEYTAEFFWYYNSGSLGAMGKLKSGNK